MSPFLVLGMRMFALYYCILQLCNFFLISRESTIKRLALVDGDALDFWTVLLFSSTGAVRE